MRWAAGILAGVMLAAPARGVAQGSIGEFRLFGSAAWAPRPADAAPVSQLYGPPDGAVMAGLGASLSFITGPFAAGPEAMVFLSANRKVHQLGAVARVGFAAGPVRPYLLVGAGVYSWNQRKLVPFDPSSPGQDWGPFWVGDVTHFSGNAGGGIIVGIRWVSLVAEIRGHRSVSSGDEGSRRALTISAGARAAW